ERLPLRQMSRIGRWPPLPASFFTSPTKCGLISQSGPSFHDTWMAPTGWPTKRNSISLRTSISRASGVAWRKAWASFGVRCFIGLSPLAQDYIRNCRYSMTPGSGHLAEIGGAYAGVGEQGLAAAGEDHLARLHHV